MDSRSLIMADSLPDSHFCLPTEFLTDEDRFAGFPIDFPYELDSSVLVDSTETESSDDDEFVVGLTRRLTQQLAADPKKKTITSGSPKSTLCGIGSWSMSSNSTNGEVSPPTTPPSTRYDKSEPIYAGAGDVYSNQRFVYSVSQLQNQDQFDFNQLYSVWGRQQLKAVSSHLPHQNQIQNRGTSSTGYHGVRFVRPLGLPQSSWPPLQVQQNKYRSPTSSAPGSGAVKRSCAGTGVFLPRRFDDSTHIKKSDCSNVLFQAKVEGNNYQSVNCDLASKHDHVSKFSDGIHTKNALLSQQKVNLPTEYEICLPQEWIY